MSQSSQVSSYIDHILCPGALGMIDKQRRGWEEAREKAEQMSQIFDSLIITSNLLTPQT